MPEFLQMVSALREQMNANLSRSDVLRPLSWLIGITLAGLLVVVGEKGPSWTLTVLGVLLCVEVILYVCAYIFCLFIDRDALRSERYSLNKMAIEHGLIGDSDTGLFSPEAIQPADQSTSKLIESSK